tara:strand:- start:738 stop:2405 length:1668 start_codon:yes stop_codon:yes gene_type:complete
MNIKILLPKVFILQIIIFSTLLYSQKNQEGTPYSILHHLDDLNVPTVTMAPVNVDSLLLEDELNPQELPPRFGFPHEVQLNLNNTGLLETFEDGSQLWRLRIYCPDAFSINLIYSEFYLFNESTLFIYDDEKRKILGAFSGENNFKSGIFSTSPIPGDVCIIELFMPSGIQSQRLQISTIIHAYKNIFGRDRDFGQSAFCNINVHCGAECEPWGDQIRSVGMIIDDSNSRMCSGVLVNNLDNDINRRYLLTAYHCIRRDADYNEESSIMVLFNYESSDSLNPDEEPSTDDWISGVRLISMDTLMFEHGDFALLEILDTIPSSYNVYYSGWSREDSLVSDVVGIHHPKQDIKKISFDGDPISLDYDGSHPDYVPNSHWFVENWDEGTTENGSSGSPLFNPDKKVIGLCHSDNNQEECTEDFGTYYSSIAFSWDTGDSPDTRLKEWLDPSGSNAFTCEGRNWDQIFGCTDSTAFNYNENANEDDGSCNDCTGIDFSSGDINFDLIVDILDIIELVNLILSVSTPDSYESFCSADVQQDSILDIFDILAIVDIIIDNS